jgi:hypothetical protein
VQTLDKLEKLIVCTSAAKQATLLSQAHAHSAKSAAKTTVNTPPTTATTAIATAMKCNISAKQQQQHVHNKTVHRQQPHVANNKNTSSKVTTAAVPKGSVVVGQALNKATAIKPTAANGNANGNAAAVGATGSNAAYREALKLKRITKVAREGIDRYSFNNLNN